MVPGERYSPDTHTARGEQKYPILERLLIEYARRFPLRKGKLRLIEMLWAASIRQNDTKRLATLKYGGFKLPCNLTEDLQRQFYFFGTYFLEEHILTCWEEEAKTAKIIFDVGANLGIFSFAALSAQPSAIVHAFEPTPEIASQLRKAAEENKLSSLNIHEVAVSSTNGHAKLNRFRGESGHNDGMNYVFGSVNEEDPNRVPIVRLDDFCHSHCIDHIDLLKIDVQGQEHDVFAGGERLIRNGCIDLIFFELNWAQDHHNCSARKSIRLLENGGYEFSAAGKKLHWRQPGAWMYRLSDVLARRASRTSPCPE